MLNIFKKKKDKDIIILQKTEPNVCGGTDTTLDRNAPKEIDSDDVTLFDVTSALDFVLNEHDTDDSQCIRYVSAFAVPTDLGTFMFLATRGRYIEDGEKISWALVSENVMPKIAALIKECELAKQNGYHSQTHGLPENFGGSVYVEYAGGEKISFSDNRAPLFTNDTGKKIAKLFRDAMDGKRAVLPDIAELTEIRFYNGKSDSRFTKAVLRLLPDGSGINKKIQRFDGDKEYESEKEVDAGTVETIKERIAECGIIAWAGLPGSKYGYGADKSLTFVFSDGTEICIKGDRTVPQRISRGFFDIELEMTTRH